MAFREDPRTGASGPGADAIQPSLYDPTRIRWLREAGHRIHDGKSVDPGWLAAQLWDLADLLERPEGDHALTARERHIAVTAWEIGRAYGHREVAEAIEAARKLPIPKPATRTLEQQISGRLAEFDALAKAYYERTGRREWLGTDNLDEVKPW